MGIGVVNPQEKLELAGNARIYGDLILPQLGTTVEEDDELLFITDDGRVVRGGSGAQLADEAYIRPCRGGLPRWASVMPDILYTGEQPDCYARVGINTNNPAQELQVIGSGHFSEKLGIGIGANNPQTELDVRGNGIFTGNLMLGSTTPTLDVALYIQSKPSHVRAIQIKDASGADVFRVNPDGETWSTEMFVALKQDFPDYVFNPDYELMSLEEIKAFIHVHGHLPKMPAAAEVEKTGSINLGEQQLLQLEKIEELTLHLIKMNERMEKLEQENGELRAKLSK